MYLIERQKKMLGLLLSSDNWMTGIKIGYILGITDRTVRNDVKNLNEALKEYPKSYVEAVRGKGYLLVSEYRKELLEQVEQTNVNETTKGRLCNLALEILTVDEPIMLDDLEEDFFISRTSLEATIKSINVQCAADGVQNAVRRKKNAIYTECEEEERRKLIRKFIVISEEQSGEMLKDEYGFLNREHTGILMKHICHVLAKQGMQLMDKDMMELVLYLYIQCMRIQKGCLVTMKCGKTRQSVPRMLWKIAEELTNLLEHDMKVRYPEKEMILLTCHLSDVRMMKVDRFSKKEIEAIIEPRYLVIVEEMLNDIKNDFMLDLTKDEELFVDLILHIRFSIKFGKDSPHQGNPLLETMKNQYPFVFELSTYIFSRFYEALGIELNENQLGYIAAHLGAALERLENRESGSDLKIAVCSNMNLAVIRLLMAKLHSLYTNVEISGPYPVYDIERIISEEPAMIVTTTSSNIFREVQIPVITISPMLESEDVLAINKKIGELKREAVVPGVSNGIEQYFDEELYFPQLEMDSRESVLQFLCRKVVKKGYASEELLGNTLEREKIAPTIFANKIAAPHPIRVCAYKTVIAVAVLKNSVPWGNLEARLIFLLVVRGSDMKYMNSFFELTSKLVWDKEKVRKLIEIEQFNDFIKKLA
ncbi:BglG family transcription antiterminator [Clostridium sp. C105KSO13]|uniref:BglG family transcription antiterminator n=1 Tax=Clostridium sp. C105KSO13 TaxID=1776045 RepID=UPI0007407215|nr:PTS sugar transporter subunit IIA [Clostridium sp. C105KSO13]CUX38301.1 putative licABCH operon regulator [Clostridium sp. C105KSO13]